MSHLAQVLTQGLNSRGSYSSNRMEAFKWSQTVQHLRHLRKVVP